MDGRSKGWSTTRSRHAYVQLFSIARVGLRNALALRLEESVKNKEAWKRRKDKGRGKDEGGEERSWKLVPAGTR